MSEWDPAGYLEMIYAEIPNYDLLQAGIIDATEGIDARAILELGVGSGETSRRLLDAHAGATLCGIDSSPEMLAAARASLPADRVRLELGALEGALPQGPFDLVVSALTVHHLEGEAKADLFVRIKEVMGPRARLVLGDVVVPDDPANAVVPLEAGFDFPSPLSDQMRWLKDAGLEPRLFWSEEDLAVITAEASVSSPGRPPSSAGRR